MEKKTLREIGERLKWERENRYDIVVSTEELKTSVDVGTGTIRMDVPQPDGEFKHHGITGFAHGQIANKTGIPKKYYDKMIEDGKPDLLATNINAWLPQKDKRLVRVLGNDVRALLSDRYRVIDNHDVLYTSLEEINNVQEKLGFNIDIERADVTETRLYMKAISKDLTDDIMYKPTESSPVYGGIIITNSEVGCGAFKVEPYMHVQVCSNGMVSDMSLRRIHVGREKDAGIINWSDVTRELEDRALWSKIRDMIQQTFDPEIFHKWVDEINGVAQIEIAKPTLAIDNVIKRFDLPKGRKDDLLDQFAKESPNMWGLSMAVTRVAQDLENYDQQVEWEKVGSKILETPPKVFEREI